MKLRFEQQLRAGLWLCALGLALGSCSGSDGEKQEPLPTPTTEDGQHFLADKPLKTFTEGKSDQWKHREAIEAAEKRAKARTDRFSAVVEPTTPDPLKGGLLPLEIALDGLEGEGPVKALFETSEGEFSCTLDTENKPLETAHFIGLARGKRPWWDSAKGSWTLEPFYSSLPVYKVVPGQAFYSGCPMGNGFADVGFHIGVPVERIDVADEAYALALVTRGRSGAIGSQFLVTATAKPRIREKTHVIGSCEGAGSIQKIAGQDATPSGYPLEEVAIRRVKIHR
jgi:peptidyl-prolyl cis-trans isomerase A (cyclophilin A)